MALTQQLLILMGLGTTATSLAQGVQVPPVVKQQVLEIQDRFGAVLDEECPSNQCYSVGCKASRFETLDQTQDSSLPGLETDGNTVKPQYHLSSVLCEFAYEPTLSADDLNNIRQRVGQKVKTVGVNVQLSTRRLQTKASEPAATAVTPKEPPVPMVDPSIKRQLWAKILPFVPWFLAAFMITGITLLLIWASRRLGRTDRRAANARTRSTDLLTAAAPHGESEPSPRMLLARVEQLRGELKADKRLTELTLKRYFEEQNYTELCSFLKYCGPDLLSIFKEKAEYRDALATLSQKYASTEVDDDPALMWRYLDRLERDITAAKVRIDAEPLSDDFAFLAAIEVEQFVGILRELTEEEAIAAVAYAPRSLRERFFANANPSFTARFVEHLTNVDKMPDSFVRSVAVKLRKIYAEKGDSLRIIRVDRTPLLEEALNALAPAKRKQLIAEIGKDNPTFMASLAPTMFLADTLPLLSAEVLTEAFLTVTPEEAGQFLASFRWSQQVLDKINPRLAEGIRRNIPMVPPEDSRLARAAHEKIGGFVKKLHAQGTIDLRTLNARLMEGDS